MAHRSFIRSIAAASVLAALLAVPGVALGHVVTSDPSFPSSPPGAEDRCKALDGFVAFIRDEGVSLTCIVDEVSTANVPASHPQKAWMVDVQTTERVTYVSTLPTGTSTDSHTHVVLSQVVTGCWNHQGHAIVDFASNPNCVPSS